MAVQGHLLLAAWPISGNPSMLADFQKEVSTFSISPGEPQQNRRTPLLGGSGSADPLSAPLKDVLQFLLLEFQAGKQFRTINTTRSAISMTHMEVDRVRIVLLLPVC